MRYLEMGLASAAVAFVVANAAISLLTILLWRTVRRSRLRARALLLIRLAPAVGSASLVLGLVIPAYWFFEPRATDERAGPALVVFVILAGILVAAGLRRILVSWLDTQRLERAWRSQAVGSAPLEIPVRAYRVSSKMPLAAVVGVVRPRLFVSGPFLDALSAEERQAVLDHEAGHLRSLDNLQRTLMRLAADWLSFSSAGREIEAAWALAAEEAADDHAAGPDRARALDLAGALLKASRFTPFRCASASNFYDGAPIARRVARLLNDPPTRRIPTFSSGARIALVLALLGASAMLAGPAFRAAYTMTEAAVRLVR